MFWLEQTFDDLPPHDDWLSEADQCRLASFAVAKRRDEWRLGRWTAKRAAGAFLGRNMREVEVVAASDGAPEVVGEQVVITLSHSGSRALCVVALSGSMGCDLERVEPRGRPFVLDYFTPPEVAFVDEHPEYDWLPTLIWSAKESTLKALRQGLRLDTRIVEITLKALDGRLSNWRRLSVRYREDGRDFAGWWRLEGEMVRTIVGDAGAPVGLRLTGTGW